MNNNKIFKPRFYHHIDKIIDIKDVVNRVKDKNYVISHAFYPFLSYKIDFKKFTKEVNSDTLHHWKIKERPIKYASHIDRCIYQWYSYKLNEYYNKYCNENDLNNTSIAYRTCLKGKNNINFAADAINFIKCCGPCYILVSDFSSFFDTIEHKMLKKNVCRIMNIDKLEEDFYKIFRSMTKFSYIEKDDVVNYLVKNKIETLESLKRVNSLFDHISWGKAKKDLKIYINREDFGIPQGSSLSGVFANIYMIDFDTLAHNYAKSKNGLYMRYSDDLIIIIPKNQVSSITEIWNKLVEIKSMYSTLKMNIDKTSGYMYDNKKISSLHEEIKGMKNGGTFISYLGFSFDGKYVKFRDKTLIKFFYKLYRKIDFMIFREHIRIKRGIKKHTKIDKHQILKGIDSNPETRKFIDYVNRARKVFPNEKYIVNFRKNVKNKVFLRFEKERKRINNKKKVR